MIKAQEIFKPCVVLRKAFFMKKIFILFLLSSFTLVAQQEVKTYYPPLYKNLKETYTILNGDSTKIDGTYTKYFEDGSIGQLLLV